MEGRIIKITEDEIVIGNLKKVFPITPFNYQKDWKEHRNDYGNYQLEDFRIYDERLNKYRKQKFELETLHLGNVELKQN